MSSRKTDLSPENLVEIIKIHQEEWRFSVAHYWSIIYKMSIIIFLVALVPFISERLGFDAKGYNLPIYIFPIISMLCSILTFIATKSDVKRIASLRKKINQALNSLDADYVREGARIRLFGTNISLGLPSLFLFGHIAFSVMVLLIFLL